MRNYTNYHRHTCLSNVRVSDSTVTQEAYAKRAVELNQKLLASTEHGWAGDVFLTHDLAKQYGLKFLVGAEAYWVRNREEKDRTNCHIFLGAKNENGRQAINDILSEANLTGFYGQPRVDIPLLLSLPKDDVIVTTACAMYWKYPDIEQITAEFAKRFGKNFYLEVQYHNVEAQRILNQRILKLHNELKIPLIMGCDSHYIYPEQEQVRLDFLVSKGMNYGEEQGWYMDYPSADVAYERFANQCVLSHQEICDAMDNTNVFLEVEEYDSPVFNTDIKMPSIYPDKTQEEKDEIYKQLVWQGWDEYKKEVPEEQHEHYKEEIQKEIQTVVDTKMSDYFILDNAIMKKGQENGGWLTRTGRGSAVSFVTNMLLGLTKVDRVSAKIHMYPERFMSTTRILSSMSLPDVDCNVAPVEPFARAQQEILGEDHAYPMIAYGTFQKSAAWKLYAKSQGVSFEIANAVSNQIKKYENAVKHAPEDDKDSIDVLDYIDKEYHEIYEKSKDYLGIVTSWSIAPCGYALYSGSIRKEIGLVKVKDHICCALDGHAAENNHFLKNDLLKVSVVDLIYRAYHRIGMEPPTVNELLQMCPPDDKCWDIYAQGCTIGINQCEQNGTAQRVMNYKPKNISELGAFVAAIRPGGAQYVKKFIAREPFSYGVKVFDDLIQTDEMPNSFLLYQEQVMAVLNFAGINMSDCYTAVKHISKKRKEKVLVYKETFVKGFTDAIIKEGESKEEAEDMAHQLWKVIEDSCSYSFNACVSGDTIIQRPSLQNNQYRPTIEEMYKIKNDLQYAKQTGHMALRSKYQKGYGKALSMFKDGRIRENSVVDIREAGVRKTYRVETESGEYLDCTMNHKFPTPSGYKHLSELKVGDELYVVGKYEKCRDLYPFTNGDFEPNLPKKGQMGFQSKPNGDSVVYKRFKKESELNKSPCEDCGVPYSKGKRFEVHHIDFDRTNNNYNNYAWLCASCHKKRHYANGRRKKYDKGLPTLLSPIKSITYIKTAMTYDVEMADPAHTIISQSGLVASNSHSYCVALDSLYCAWLKAHHPLEFYEILLTISEEKGDKDKMNALKEEAESYFKIKFPPFRYGQDNSRIKADLETNTITNSLSAIKGFSTSVGDILYRCSQEVPVSDGFIAVLKWLDGAGIKASKVRPLIQIDYFQDFGNVNELLKVLDFWEFMKQGNAKTVKKETCPREYADVFDKLCTQTAATYRIEDKANECFSLYQKNVKGKLKPPTMRQMIGYSIDILGYADVVTNREVDRRRLLITDVSPVGDSNGKPWAYRIGTRSLGSGKIARLTVKTVLYDKNPIKTGDIVYAANLYKNNSGYWYLLEYKKES